MKTSTKNRQRTKRANRKEDVPFTFANEPISKSKNSGMSIASKTATWAVVFILMIASVGGLRAYTANLDVSVNNKQNEMNLVDERINELQGEIDLLFSDSLNVSLNCDADITSDITFVHDLWEVGG